MTAAALDDPAGQRAAGAAAPIRVGNGVPPPRKVHDVPPVYPSAARTLRVQGLVILEATIGPTGEVVDVQVADRQGEYRISNLPAGTYTVTFSLPGFSSVIWNGVVIGAGLASRVDADLAVGGKDDGSSVVSDPQRGTAAALAYVPAQRRHLRLPRGRGRRAEAPKGPLD